MTQTPGTHLTQPLDGGDTDTWGAEVNLDWTLVDRNFNSILSVAVPDTNVTLTADGTTNDQSIYAGLNFTGALTAQRTITLPSNVKIGMATNSTSGSQNIVLSAGGATSLTIPPGSYRVRYEVDGSNNVTSPRLSAGSYSAGSVGYQYTGAFLRQWGVASSGGGGTVTVSFSPVFSAVPYYINAIHRSAGTVVVISAVASTITASSVQFLTSVSSSGVGISASFFWEAFGKA